MKTTFKITKYLYLLSFFLIFSCSSDDDSPGIIPLTAQNLIVSVDENQAAGATVGTVQAIGQGALSFSITSQTPAGALSINSTTGELTVADASAFDFETNPIINATVSIIDALNTGTATVAISINDMDDIEFLLSTSQADYTAAADGDWVIITETEYNALASNLNEVNPAGTTDAQYSYSTASNSSAGPWVLSNTTDAIMPTGSYVFAFKYYASANANITENKVKQSSTSQGSGFQDLGGFLPDHVGADLDVYFVLKGNNESTTSNGYLAIFMNTNNGMGYHTSSQNGYIFDSGDVNELTSPSSSLTFLYQGLSTTQKQW